jgi:Ion channel
MTGQAARARWDSFAERNADQFAVVLFLVIATYCLGSLLPFEGWQGILIATLGTFTAIYALAAAQARSRLMPWVLLAAGLEILATITGAIADQKQFEGGAALVQMLLFLLAALAVLRAVLTDDHVGGRAIAGAISVYIMLGLLYAFVYVGLDRIQGDFFGAQTQVQEGDFLFFSMTTLTTTGYGNLVPSGQPGRMLAALEMLTGQIFVVTLVARLVTSWQPGEWLRGGAGISRRRRRDS